MSCLLTSSDFTLVLMVNPSQTTTSVRGSAPTTAGNQQFVRGLGLTNSATLVIGSIIGSGIFIVSADIARLVNSPALLIAAWGVTGFMSIAAALSYGELAAMDLVLLRYKPQYIWPRLIIVLTGIPVYFVWSRRNKRTSIPAPFHHHQWRMTKWIIRREVHTAP